MKIVDVLIPTYKPGREFYQIITKLEKQSYPINQIIIMNTDEVFWQKFSNENNFVEADHGVEVQHISKESFDHGRTRDLGMRKSEADIVICMTQDALPADDYLLETLVKSLEDETIAVSYARQLAKSGCSEAESYTRKFNYPDKPVIKSKEDIEKLGVKTFFNSNVCSAYKRNIYLELGGFIQPTIFNEDMIFAAKAIKEGWKIAYESEAKVFHSHNYKNQEQFHRNFDLGVSQADNPDIFNQISVESEGVKLVWNTCKYLASQRKKRYILPMVVTSAYKFVGFKMGKKYKALPKKMVKKCSMNQNYWHNV